MSLYKRISRIWLEGRACKRCGHYTPGEVCVHHSRGRLGSLKEDIRHWIPLCLRCHDWVHNNIGMAREDGYICEKGLWNTPDNDL